MAAALQTSQHAHDERVRQSIQRVTDRLSDRDAHTQHPRDQQGQPHDTRLAQSTAGAAAWLPHSKHRDTRVTSG